MTAIPELDLGIHVELGGRYLRLEQIGRGASATVYKGLDRVTRQPVVIKELAPHLRSDPVSIERLRRELHVTRLIAHPRVVAALDVIEDGDGIKLVMQFAPGESLKEHVLRRGPLPPAEAVAILAQILDVVAACHRQGVIHRDLKPQNIMIDADGSVRLLDFGIARITALTDLTQTGSSIGTPEYMAPEQYASSRCDHRADLYAIGVIAHELLTGTPPFSGDSIAVLYRCHTEEKPPQCGTWPWLDIFVDRLLEKKPHRRYQLAEEALTDLRDERLGAQNPLSSPRRDCVRCGVPTLADFPLCTSCGFDDSCRREDGTVTLMTQHGTDGRLLLRFIKEFFHVTPFDVHPFRSQVLAESLDPLLARYVLRRARERGIILTAKREAKIVVRIGRRPRVAALAMLCSLAFVIIGNITPVSGGMLFFRGLLGFGAGMIAGSIFDRLFLIDQQPLVMSLGLLTPSRKLLRSELLELRRFFASRVCPRIKETVAAIVEGHYLLNHREVHDDELARSLRDVAGLVTRLAEGIRQLEEAYATADVAALTEAYHDERRLGATPRLRAIEARLRECFAAEDRVTRFHAKLIHLLHVYYAALGERTPGLGEAATCATTRLDEAVASLALDLEALTEARAALDPTREAA